MKKYYVLYNPLANNGKGKEEAELLEVAYPNAAPVYFDVTGIDDYARFFDGLDLNVPVVLCGGDGTINRFLNDTRGLDLKREILYFGCGSGNDFLRDVGGKQDRPVSLTEYVKNLPTVTVRGKERVFINGVGFGIDGYCCEEGDRLRAESDKPVNYAGIAVKGLFGKYRPTDATVTVDGNEFRFKKVWIAPTMNGRHYGGGMIAAPKQDRNSGEVSLVLFHGCGRLRTLTIFPKIFKGEHVKSTKYVTVLTGKTVTVRFDEPRPLQIDGETVPNVREYAVKK